MITSIFTFYLLLINLPKIRFLDRLVVEQFLACAFHGQPSRFKHVGRVRRVKCHVCVLLDQEDCDALVVDLLDDIKDALYHERRESQ